MVASVPPARISHNPAARRRNLPCDLYWPSVTELGITGKRRINDGGRGVLLRRVGEIVRGDTVENALQTDFQPDPSALRCWCPMLLPGSGTPDDVVGTAVRVIAVLVITAGVQCCSRDELRAVMPSVTGLAISSAAFSLPRAIASDSCMPTLSFSNSTSCTRRKPFSSSRLLSACGDRVGSCCYSWALP